MTQFTQKAIMESFTKLLNERPLDKITVKDIVEDCDVNRKTFYYHYRDIYALLDAVLDAELERIRQNTNETATWQQRYLELAGYAFKNKKAVYHIFNSSRRDQLTEYLYSAAAKAFEAYILKEDEALRCDERDVKLLAELYTSAAVGMTTEWIRRGMKEDPTEYVGRIGRLLNGTLKLALANMRAERQ